MRGIRPDDSSLMENDDDEVRNVQVDQGECMIPSQSIFQYQCYHQQREDQREDQVSAHEPEKDGRSDGVKVWQRLNGTIQRCGTDAKCHI